jgi:hypothetical protein
MGVAWTSEVCLEVYGRGVARANGMSQDHEPDNDKECLPEEGCEEMKLGAGRARAVCFSSPMAMQSSITTTMRGPAFS